MRRLLAPVAATSLILLGTTGCTFGAEIANLEPYDPSDGVSANVGDLGLRNILLVANDEGEANLVMTVVNDSGEDVSLNVQYDDGAARTTSSLSIPGFPERTRIGDNPADGVVVTASDLTAGGLYAVYFEYGDVPGELVMVPVLDGSLPEYESLVP